MVAENGELTRFPRTLYGGTVDGNSRCTESCGIPGIVARHYGCDCCSGIVLDECSTEGPTLFDYGFGNVQITPVIRRRVGVDRTSRSSY